MCILKLRLLGEGPYGTPPLLKPKRAWGPPPPSPQGGGGGNQSWLTATQSVVIRYLTDQKGQPNQLREGTEWHRMAWVACHGMEWPGMT